MPKTNCTNTMLLLDVKTKDAILTPFPYSLFGTKYDYYKTDLAGNITIRNSIFDVRRNHIYRLFATLVIRDGFDPMKLHSIFLELEEWRYCSDFDTPGLIDAIRNQRTNAKKGRNEEISRRILWGESITSIAGEFSLSPTRAREIVANTCKDKNERFFSSMPEYKKKTKYGGLAFDLKWMRDHKEEFF